MPIKETISASEWAVINLERMEWMFGIIVSTGTVIKDNETNEIIHDIENEDEVNQFIFLRRGKWEI